MIARPLRRHFPATDGALERLSWRARIGKLIGGNFNRLFRETWGATT